MRDLARAARDKITLDLSHAMWVQLGRQVRPDLLRIVSAAFDTGVHEADFLHHAEAARAAINTDVARDTHGQTPHLLPEGDVTAETRIVLTDAEYLQASWSSRFPHDGTRQAGFQVPGIGEAPPPSAAAGRYCPTRTGTDGGPSSCPTRQATWR